MKITHWIRRSGRLALAGWALAVGPQAAVGQETRSVAELRARAMPHQAGLLAKLTYVGSDMSTVATVVFGPFAKEPDVKQFQSSRAPGVSYHNDSSPVTFKVSQAEMRSVLDAVEPIPALQYHQVTSDRLLSFALADGGGNVFEAILNRNGAGYLLSALRNALAENPAAIAAVSRFACDGPLRGRGSPSDVTSDMEVTFSGMRLNRVNGRFVSMATLRNRSSRPVNGPLSLLIEPAGRLQVANAGGFTCAVLPVGVSYLEVNLPGDSLAPGETAQATVEFRNPDLRPINPRPRVLAGKGAR